MTNSEIKKYINLAKKNDEKAFTELIKYIQNDLYRVAKCRLLNNDDAMDAVQETIISIYLSLEQLKNSDKFKNWCLKILINNCNLIYSKRKNGLETQYEFLEEKNGYIDEYNFELNDILKKLDDDEKYIITLFYIEDLTSKEISKILNMNINTVKTKLLRAKNKIKGEIYG